MSAGGSSGGRPELPPGYTSQQTDGFRTGDATFAYEFHRVYRSSVPAPATASGRASEIDQDRSFWLVTWAELVGTAREHCVSRSLSFGQANQGRNPRDRVAWTDFSSALHMRIALPEMMGMLPRA